MSIQDTDLLLVNRSSQTQKLEAQNMSTIEDNDLFLVNRPGDSKTYKVTGGDLLEYTGGAINPDIDGPWS